MLAALEGREEAGFHDYVDTSWQDGMATLMEGSTTNYSFTKKDRKRFGNRIEQAGPFVDVWETTDGHVSITATTAQQWENLALAVGHPEWRDDPANATWEGRAANPVIDNTIRAWFLENTTESAMDMLQALRIPSAPVLTCEAVLADEQVIARATFVEVDHPVAGTLAYPHRALHVADPDGPVEFPLRRAPLLGEHTAEVLAGVGVCAADLEHLRAQGVI